ncbi:methyltransferase domain-containing protein [Brachybacterium sp. JHP9]|uniref:Methyltransferase domain-containing protein n=1 Tax=Brachybacterium equifaecis TaxID=2910770 RepID=A0ABT0R2T3_9MICO|nr:class I SAM-dependent methyltransferase [Brachybacterium equifaecis]MCL6424211.1 methyltransferase domain-containing protein [Brachybacterium equifaecis]
MTTPDRDPAAPSSSAPTSSDATASDTHAVVPAADEGEDPAAYWEQRYAAAETIWSGAVNGTLSAAVGDLPPGRALDLGCGEGGDAIWLAQQGWDVLGADISPSAVDRATRAAEAAGLDPERIRFLAVDLSPWARSAPGAALGADREAATLLEGPFDLVTASFFLSEQELERTLILRRAAAALAPNGRLVILSHAAPAPGSPHAHHSSLTLLDPAQEREELALPADEWEVEREELVERPAVEHRHGHHEDGLLRLRRVR